MNCFVNGMGKLRRVNFIFPLSIFVNTIILTNTQSHPSIFYEAMDSFAVNCSAEFDTPRKLDCACVSGLWILYGTCSENVTIRGDQALRCHKLPGISIGKAVQVLRNRQDLAAISPSGDIAQLQTGFAYNLEMYMDWVLLTGSDWTLLGSNGERVCLSVIEHDSYCYFSRPANLPEIVKFVEKGCDKFDYFVDPEKCEPVEEYGLISADKQFCSYIQVLKKRYVLIGDNSCGLSTGERHKLVKRNTGNSPGNGGSTEGDAFTDSDEDFEITLANINNTEGDYPNARSLMGDAILEFMEGMLDDLLGVQEGMASSKTGPNSKSQDSSKTTPRSRNGRRKKATLPKDVPSIEQIDKINTNPLNLTYSNPVYEFLEISKRIMYKTCPPFYVKPAFLNLAVSTFIKLQQNYFKFSEHTFQPNGFRRILGYLRKCEQAAIPFQFLPSDCEGKVDGKYLYDDSTLELVVSNEVATLLRDPMVETVWKVFLNAHSYCYQFFNKTLDHHRFTAWMVPLFQNQMNDIWSSGVISENSLSGLFGNQIEVQRNLAYCFSSSRLESSYPFDLPRPHRVHEFGNNGHSLDGNANHSEGRQKRDTGSKTVLTSLSCIDDSQPLLCPDHVNALRE